MKLVGREDLDEATIQKVKEEVVRYLISMEGHKEPELGALEEYLEGLDLNLTGLSKSNEYYNIGDVYRTNYAEVAFAIMDLFNEKSLGYYPVCVPAEVGMILGTQGFPMFELGLSEEAVDTIQPKIIEEGREKAEGLKSVLESGEILGAYESSFEDGEAVLEEYKTRIEEDMKSLLTAEAREAYYDILHPYLSKLRKDINIEDRIVWMVSNRLGGFISNLFEKEES